MKISELKTKSRQELNGLLEEKRRKADELRYALYQKKLKNVKELSGVKKDVARILTLLKKI